MKASLDTSHSFDNPQLPTSSKRSVAKAQRKEQGGKVSITNIQETKRPVSTMDQVGGLLLSALSCQPKLVTSPVVQNFSDLTLEQRVDFLVRADLIGRTTNEGHSSIGVLRANMSDENYWSMYDRVLHEKFFDARSSYKPVEISYSLWSKLHEETEERFDVVTQGGGACGYQITSKINGLTVGLFERQTASADKELAIVFTGLGTSHYNQQIEGEPDEQQWADTKSQFSAIFANLLNQDNDLFNEAKVLVKMICDHYEEQGLSTKIVLIGHSLGAAFAQYACNEQVTEVTVFQEFPLCWEKFYSLPSDTVSKITSVEVKGDKLTGLLPKSQQTTIIVPQDPKLAEIYPVHRSPNLHIAAELAKKPH